jgi:cell wall-associated NlpC family hydrolase
LVQIALLAAGKLVPRDSDQQAEFIGTALGENATLQRGDLIFWEGHVGIMQDGNRIVHANAHHMAVATETLDLVTARATKSANRIVARRRVAG